MSNLTCYFGITLPFTPRPYRYTIASFYVTTAVSSGILNSLVLFTIWKTPSLHKPSYFLIASIALADFLAGFFGEIMLATSHLFISEIDGRRSREWRDITCKSIIVCKSYGYILCGSSISTLVAMSVDRLLAITMKTTYNNNSKVFKIMGLCLVLACGVITFETCYTAIGVTLDKLRRGFFSAAIIFTVALTSIVTIYSIAYRKLKNVMINRVRPQQSSRSNGMNLEKYRKTLNTFVLVCVFLTVCYTPFIIASVIMFYSGLQGSGDKTVAIVMFLDISEYLVYCSATINPILYVWRMRDLKTAVKHVVRRQFCLHRISVVKVQNADHTIDENKT